MDKQKKAELKAAYLQSRPIAGVLGIRNLKNGKILVEGSRDVRALINRYRSSLSFIGCRNLGLQEDWNVLGPGEFAFEVLESFEPGPQDSDKDCLELVRAIEAAWLQKLQPWGDRGYNRDPSVGKQRD